MSIFRELSHSRFVYVWSIFDRCLLFSTRFKNFEFFEKISIRLRLSTSKRCIGVESYRIYATNCSLQVRKRTYRLLRITFGFCVTYALSESKIIDARDDRDVWSFYPRSRILPSDVFAIGNLAASVRTGYIRSVRHCVRFDSSCDPFYLNLVSSRVILADVSVRYEFTAIRALSHLFSVQKTRFSHQFP